MPKINVRRELVLKSVCAILTISVLETQKRREDNLLVSGEEVEPFKSFALPRGASEWTQVTVMNG